VKDDRAADVLLRWEALGEHVSRRLAVGPGKLEVVVVLLPNVRTSKTTAKARTTRAPTTTHFRRAANIPSPCRNAP
jgi:hypothetical protein